MIEGVGMKKSITIILLTIICFISFLAKIKAISYETAPFNKDDLPSCSINMENIHKEGEKIEIKNGLGKIGLDKDSEYKRNISDEAVILYDRFVWNSNIKQYVVDSGDKENPNLARYVKLQIYFVTNQKKKAQIKNWDLVFYELEEKYSDVSEEDRYDENGNYIEEYDKMVKRAVCRVSSAKNINKNSSEYKYHYDIYIELDRGTVDFIDAELSYEKDDKTKTITQEIVVRKEPGKDSDGYILEDEIVTHTVVYKTEPTTNVDKSKYYICQSENQEKATCKKGSKIKNQKNCENKRYDSKKSCKAQLKQQGNVTMTTVLETISPTINDDDIINAGLAQGTAPSNAINCTTTKDSNGNVVTKEDGTPAKKCDINPAIECKDIASLINKYWKYIMVLAPVALILLVTVDFTKAIIGSDADALKKASKAAVNRTIAVVALCMLPFILGMILSWFDLELCI